MDTPIEPRAVAPPATPPSSEEGPVEDRAPPPPKGLWARTKHLVVHNILHLDDTPHRIALGVFLGFVVGATPTIGLQMIIYVAIAAIVGANKVSGILPVWLSNPLTAVPLYYSNWRIGRFLLSGSADEDGGRALIESVVNLPGAELPLWERVTSSEFWSAAMDAFVAMGAELWLGSLVVGLLFGIFGYWAAYRGVIAFRGRPSPPPDPERT